MADSPSPAPAQPTAEDVAKVNAVGTAGATAAANAPSPEQAKADARDAMRAEADKQGLPMSDEDIEKVANLFVDKTVAAFEQRGAFDAPPEPVRAPDQAAAPPAPGEPPAGGEQAPQAPQKRTWAHRFMGV